MKIFGRLAIAVIPWTAAAFFVAATATAAAAATGPDAVHPLTGSMCNTQNSITPAATQCTTVTGSGLQIASITGQANTIKSLANLHVEFYGPNGLITNTAAFTLDGTRSFTWHNPSPTAEMKPGDYCTELWQYNAANGNYDAIVSACVDVHA